MRLRTKLFLITATSILPVVVLTVVRHQQIKSQAQSAFVRLLDDGEQAIRLELSSAQSELQKIAKRLADDEFVATVLVELARGSEAQATEGTEDTLDARAVRALVEAAPRVMEQRGLDFLSIVGPNGKVLASGHFPGRQGDRAEFFPQQRQGSELRLVRMLDKGQPKTWLATLAWIKVRSTVGHRGSAKVVTVVVGRAVGESFLEHFRFPASTSARITDAEGDLLAGSNPWPFRVDYRGQRHLDLEGVGSSVVARLSLAISDVTLQSTLTNLRLTAAAIIVGLLLLGLVLGVLAQRIGKNIEAIAKGAEAVAAGDLQRTIDVRSNDEVGALAQTFNQMTHRLRDSQVQLAAAERVAAWREIAQRIAHEVKNPLFPIQTSIETLRKVRKKKPEKFEEIFEESTITILDEVGRLKRIVNEFSNFARMPTPTLESCSAAEIVQAVAALYASSSFELVLRFEKGVRPIVADKEQLTQVLVNLINNAEQALASTQRPLIRISVGPSSLSLSATDAVEIRVSDNGPGFSEEMTAKIFTPYFSTRQQSGGSGLGLAIVHRIVTDHGGRIDADGSAGATFCIRLPAKG